MLAALSRGVSHLGLLLNLEGLPILLYVARLYSIIAYQTADVKLQPEAYVGSLNETCTRQWVILKSHSQMT